VKKLVFVTVAFVLVTGTAFACATDYYQSSNGNCVHRPTYPLTTNRAPLPPPTARCADGSMSYSQHRSGTCSHHGGIAN
jgi:hypothetical protein